MLDTNEFFENEAKASFLHRVESEESEKSFMGSKILSVLLLAGMGYVGFNYYHKTTVDDEALVVKKEVVKKEIVAKIKIKPELIATADDSSNSDDEAYINALKSIESDELTEEKKRVDLDLNRAMRNIIEDVKVAENTSYTKELKKEIGVEASTTMVQNGLKEKVRKIIVKEGDTLQGLSTKFYGDPMNYKRIIASNDNLHMTDDTIYVGQTILLPY